jgi:hypothetical protein
MYCRGVVIVLSAQELRRICPSFSGSARRIRLPNLDGIHSRCGELATVVLWQHRFQYAIRREDSDAIDGFLSEWKPRECQGFRDAR